MLEPGYPRSLEFFWPLAVAWLLVASIVLLFVVRDLARIIRLASDWLQERRAKRQLR